LKLDKLNTFKKINQFIILRGEKKVQEKIGNKKSIEKVVKKKNIKSKTIIKKVPLKKRKLDLKTDTEIATDFSVKLYKQFGKIIKSVILFGSVSKGTESRHSDIDIIILIDDASVNWSLETIAWYRQELALLIENNKYTNELHINTIRLTTWWDDLLKGDPVVLNVIRNGHIILDSAGFIEPLKILLAQGKIKGTPEAIYQCLQRAPGHLVRSRAAELAAIDGVYWSFVDAAHGALIAAGISPPSPEHVYEELKEVFVRNGRLKSRYALWYKDIYELHKKIDHGEVSNLKSREVDIWQERAEEFLKIMIAIVESIISKK